MITTIFLSLLLFFVPAHPGQVCSFAPHNQTPQEIPINENGGLGGTPRQQSTPPIRASYFGGTVFVSFLQNLGDVEITIEEQSNGIILQTVVDSSTLSVALPLNMSTGDFSISFLLESGAEFSGRFLVD